MLIWFSKELINKLYFSSFKETTNVTISSNDLLVTSMLFVFKKGRLFLGILILALVVFGCGMLKTAVFSDKEIKEYGTHAELVHKPDGIYAEMFAAQAQYYAS